MKNWGLLLNILVVINLRNVFCEDSHCTINGRKAMHTVDERFLSISIDPAILFSGIKLGSPSVNLARHLAPAYIRLAGPSTPYIKFSEDDKSSSTRISADSKSLMFGPTMWWTVNQWMKVYNFTPVFALGDGERIEDEWDPKVALSLLDLSAKMDVNCYWQLGYDCTGKTEEQYLRDLRTLRKILDAFPGKKHSWKTVGCDLSECALGSGKEISRKFIEDLENVDAVMWEPKEEGHFFVDDPMYRFLGIYEPNLPIWTTAPKEEHQVLFSSGIEWAYRIGESARNGFDVIFRQPRLQELFVDTSVYWVTLLHKTVMGRNVFDVKTSTSSSPGAYIYAHCSRNQNSYPIRGAMSVMVVNNGSVEHTTSMKVAGSQLKNIDVRSYILTGSSKNSKETHLNGQKLSSKILTANKPTFTPKLRRAKATTHLTLTVPPKSVGFFVLPGARIPICLVDEDETDLILQEMHQDQKIDFPDAQAKKLFARINSGKPTNSLSDLFHKLEQEMNDDEKLYKKIIMKPLIKKDDPLVGSKQNSAVKPLMFDDSKLYDVKKLLDKTKNDFKKVDFKNLLKKEPGTDAKPKSDIGFGSGEILKALADRAKMRVGLVNSELDGFLENAFKPKVRATRDINMALLKEKTDVPQRKLKNPFAALQKEATIRKAGETSDELLADEFESAPIEDRRPTKIYAGFAEAEDDHDDGVPGLPMRPGKESLFPTAVGFPGFHSKKDKFSLEPNHAFPKLNLPILPALNIFPSKPSAVAKQAKPKKKNFIDFVKEDETEDQDEFEDFGGDAGYHTFHEEFGRDVVPIKSRTKPDRNRELWEFGDFGNFGESKGGDGDLLESEFIINGNEEVDKTIKRLENYFNKPAARHEDGDFEASFARFRRDLPKFQRGDLYERVRENMEEMKSALKRRRGERGQLNSLYGSDALNSITSNGPFRRLNTRSNVPDGADEGEKKYEQRIKNLKNRLAHRKKLEEAQGLPKQRHAGDLRRKLREHIDLSNRLRRVRSPKGTYDIRYDEIYVPSVNLSERIAAKYESKLAQIKEWKPEDILELPKIIYVTNQVEEQRKQRDPSEISHSLMPVSKRHIITNSLNNAVTRNEIDEEDEMDDYKNAINKETTIYNPSKEESGEYTLILPTKDSISLIRKASDTELKIHSAKQETSDPNTCPASDFTTENAVSKIITINDDYEEQTTLVADDDVSEANTTNTTQGSSKQNAETKDFTLNSLFKSVNNFLDKIHKKISIMF